MRAKKHLGQHFLTSRTYASRIVEAGQVQPDDVILEIGPGKGMLTTELLARGATVIAVEKDADMLPVLKEKFKTDEKNGKLKIIRGDIRDISFEALHITGPYKLIANIPYYITGELLRLFLTHEHKPTTIVFLVQKEVAQRVVAKDGKESLLSLSVKAYGTPKIIATVKAGNFSPAPKVDSAILLISDISERHFQNKQEEEHFFALIHAGFAHKRKRLAKNLETVAPPAAIALALQCCAIAENVRAEDISFETWACLLNQLH